MANHAACPVLAGEKWGANMWFWSGTYFNLDRLKRLQKGESLDDGPLTVYFNNRMTSKTVVLNWVGFDGAYVTQGSEPPGGRFESGTFISHKFHALVDGK